jgi:hypothetical protein
MMGKERGMLDGKELRISGGAVGLGGEKDAGELAATEDLWEKGIFGDASCEELVGGCDDDGIVTPRLDLVERREDACCGP